MMDKSDVEWSKSLSWVLRHGAKVKGIAMDSEGFCLLDDILRLPDFSGCTQARIMLVVKNNKKQRFSVKRNSTDQVLIRANQGHTLPIENLALIAITSVDEAPIVVHGTFETSWPAIEKEGLSRMARQHIHFCAGEPDSPEVVSGCRHDANVWIYIDVAKALQDGIKFFRSSNNVILSPGDEEGFLKPTYFAKVVHRKL